MRVTVNGKPRDVEENVTVARLLEQLGMRPEIVHVQVNGDTVPREQLADAVLAEGDTVDIVMSMGGGEISPVRSGDVAERREAVPGGEAR